MMHRTRDRSPLGWPAWIQCLLLMTLLPASDAAAATRVAIDGKRWLVNGRPTHPGTAAEGLLLNVRMVNATFEDRHFDGAADDPVYYAALKALTSVSPPDPTPAPAASAGEPPVYYPPPESQGGWRQVASDEEIESFGGMDRARITELRAWLLDSDNRNFAAVVIRHGVVVLQVERGNSAVTDARRVASVSKAICATVLAIAAEESQRGNTPRRMRFGDPAFDFIPWAHPLSDPRKARITVQQLLNHTSGICPEAAGAPNDGTWEYILGHTGDPRTARLAFDPGQGCGYSTHALAHAALVCETVTGMPYDEEFLRRACAAVLPGSP